MQIDANLCKLCKLIQTYINLCKLMQNMQTKLIYAKLCKLMWIYAKYANICKLCKLMQTDCINKGITIKKWIKSNGHVIKELQWKMFIFHNNYANLCKLVYCIKKFLGLVYQLNIDISTRKRIMSNGHVIVELKWKMPIFRNIYANLCKLVCGIKKPDSTVC